MSQVGEQTTSWGSTFQDTFNILVGKAAEKYLAPEQQDINYTVEIPAGNPPAATSANDYINSTANFVKDYQGALLLGFGGLLAVAIIIKVMK